METLFITARESVCMCVCVCVYERERERERERFLIKQEKGCNWLPD